MKFIIFICDRLRHGQFPRLPEFQFNPDHGKYIYQGRELSAEEFTAACERVFDANYRTCGFTFRPGIVEMKKPDPVLVEQSPQPVEPTLFDTPTVDESAPLFRMEGNNIFQGDERVGGIFDGTLRVARGMADLRPALEAWLQSQPQ